MRRVSRWGALLTVTALLAAPRGMWGHGIVGQRMFIEPLVTEDANIKNELVLPSAEFLSMPDGSFRSLGASAEKALYPGRWSVVVEQGVLSRHAGGRTVSGFDDLEVGTKAAVYRNERHEMVLTPAIFAEFSTGARKVSEHRTALHPEMLFAKGFGDLKTNWLRPLAVQGDAGVELSATGERERNVTYDAVLMYSIPYLNRYVRNADAGFELEHNLRLGHSSHAILGNMFPFVEFNGSTPVQGTSGSSATFLRPGTLYMGKYFQISLAADIPLRGYLPQRRVGAVALIDIFLDELSPVLGWTPFGKHHHHED